MKIPEDRMPYEVTINGVKKTYEAGATVADDASVKEIIDNENLFPPKAPDAGKPFDIPIPDPGSGSGLPPYENADINKVLMLADSGETGTGTVVAIEEQTVTTIARFGTATLTIDYTFWTPGVTVHLTVNGNNYDCVIDDTYHIQAIVDGDTVTISEGSGAATNFQGKAGTTYTVSATIEVPVPIPAPAWVTSGGVLVVHAIENEAGTAEVLDKTWQEIHDAAETSAVILVRINPVVGTVVEYISGVSEQDGQYVVHFVYMDSEGNTQDTYTADSATGYPAMSYD